MAIARVVRVDLNESLKVERLQPLFKEEIHIEEELINLEEAIKTYHIALPTLMKYPDMHRHQIKERRQIMTHCIGLVFRMLQKRKLPRNYTAKDTNFAVQKMVNLIVTDAHKVGYQIEDQSLEDMKPHMNLKSKLLTGKITWLPFSNLISVWQKIF